MNMQDWTMTSKVTAASVAGAVAWVFVQVMNQYFLAGNPMNDMLSSGIPVTAALVAAYLTRPSKGDVAKVV